MTIYAFFRFNGYKEERYNKNNEDTVAKGSNFHIVHSTMTSSKLNKRQSHTTHTNRTLTCGGINANLLNDVNTTGVNEDFPS